MYLMPGTNYKSQFSRLQAIVGKLWSNGQGQLSFLRHAVTAPPDVFTFEHAPQKVAPLEGLAGGKSPVGLPNQAWLCLDLLDTLSRLAEAGHHQTVQQILDQPIKHCPEVRFTKPPRVFVKLPTSGGAFNP